MNQEYSLSPDRALHIPDESSPALSDLSRKLSIYEDLFAPVRDFYGTSKNAVYTQIWIAICDYLLLIIAKKRYGLDPSLHSISNSIGQVLFQRTNIREIYNQPTTPVSVPEAGSIEQPTLW